jgi:hypothetical protein
MEIPFSRWYPAIEVRRSRRNYDITMPVESVALTALEAVCKDFRPFSGARAELITEHADDVFKGVIGSFGKIKNSSIAIAFIGDMTDVNVQEKVGYVGEGIILEATALKLATCWVAGFFKPQVVSLLTKIQDNERVLAVTPVGHAVEAETFEEKIVTGFGRTHIRKPLSVLATGLEQNRWPDWIKSALVAARLAPSAVNRQPWGFHVMDDSITVSVRTSGLDFNVSKRLDCGIAMLHIEVAALGSGVKGKWEFFNGSKVARFYFT